MYSKLDISDWDKEILCRILAKYPYTFYAYGSRVKGYAQKYSDLDLCYFDKIPEQDLLDIKCALEESNITIKISVVSISEFSVSFFKSIEKDLVELTID